MPKTKRNLPGFKTSTQPQSMEVQALLTIGNDPLSELFALVDIPLVLSLTCRKLRDAGPKHTKTWLGHVVTSTHLLNWARSTGMPWDARVCAAAAGGGHLEVLQWARANGCDWSESTCAAAAGGGHLKVLQWVRTVNDFCCDRSACAAAAEGGHLDCLEWIASNNLPWSPHAHYLAASNGHLAVLKWLHAQGYGIGQPQTDPIYDYHDSTLTKDAPATVAAANGNLLMLEWMRSAAYNFDFAIMAAAVRGHLDAVKWLRGVGCRWNAMACQGAAYGGHLEVLQWLRANGCDWDASECKKEAEREGHSRLLAWIMANSGPESP